MEYIISTIVEFDVEDLAEKMFYYLDDVMDDTGNGENYRDLTNEQRKDLDCAILKKALELAERE